MTDLAVGDEFRIEAEILNDGTLSDPTTLTLSVTDGDGTTTLYTYGVDAEIVRTDIGLYEAVFTTTTDGLWSYVWNATGTFSASISDAFEVEAQEFALSVTVQDDAAAAVEGARVSVFRTSDDQFVGSGVSDASGALSVNLPNDEYKLVTQLAGWMFNSLTITTNGATATVVSGVNLGTKVAPSTELTKLHGTILEATGDVPDAEVIIEVVGRGNRAFVVTDNVGIIDRSLGVVRGKRMLRPDKDGYWEIDLIAGIAVSVSIPDLGFRIITQIPNGVDSLDIRDARPWPGPGGETTSGVFDDTFDLEFE